MHPPRLVHQQLFQCLLVLAILTTSSSALMAAEASRQQTVADQSPVVTGDMGKTIGHQPLRYIGYNHDGSGVFRDCTPVTTWNEWDVKYVEAGEKGGKKKLVLDKENRQNIVWKVPHYNWCNGGMIVAGGKIFALSDRGGLGFYADRPADFVGVELFCYDPADGKELWKVDLDHWDLVPNGAEIRELVKEYNVKQVEKYRAWWPLGLAQRNHFLTEEIFAKGAPALKAVWSEMPDTFAAYKETPLYDPRKKYMQFAFQKAQRKLWPEITEMRIKILRAGYLKDPWAFIHDHLGISMMTPVSDGTHVWVSTAFGAVFCVDMSGQVVWKKWLGAGWERGWAIPSPVLCDGKLILAGLDPASKEGKSKRAWMAFDAATGEEIWQTMPKAAGYQTGPIVMNLPVGGNAEKAENFLLCQDGNVLRARDGKVVASGICCSYIGTPWAVEGDVVVAINKVATGGGGSKIKNTYEPGMNALRLKAVTADQVTAELLWHGKNLRDPVIRDGIVYARKKKVGMVAIELAAGKELKTVRTSKGTGHLSLIAGDHLFWLSNKGECAVFDLGKDGRDPKQVSVNRLGDRLFGFKKGQTKFPVPDEILFNYGAQSFFSGNRIFTRSNTELYCIGDPEAALVLSEAHR